MDKEGNKHLFSEFPGISTEAWEEKIHSDLKGSDYQKKLIWETDEGIKVRPYYREEDIESREYLEAAGSLIPSGNEPNGWTICQDIVPGMDPGEANSRARSALANGAQALRFRLGSAPVSGQGYLGKLLEGITLDSSELLFQGSVGADAIFTFLLGIAGKRGYSPKKLKGLLGADPLGKMTSTGIPIGSFDNLGMLVRKASDGNPHLRVIDVDGAQFQDAGSTLVEELAFTLAMASEYMAILTSGGISPDVAASTMQLSMASGSNYFMEIAKLRAARILWDKISEAYGTGPGTGIRIHSTTSQWNMTLYDPHVNMLRGTTEAMSSVLGGANLVSVLPYNFPYGTGSEFSDRIARNVQIILRDESYFGRVADPSSGSYYIESLTDSVAEKAWELFTEIEAMGGYRKAFGTGWIQAKVKASMQKRQARVSSGREHLLGTNAYPNFNETIIDQFNQVKEEDASSAFLEPVRPFRIASLFEEVRLETERSGKRPRVFLFKYGNPAWMTARAAFSGNFFACAGYEILEQPAFGSVEAGIAAAERSGAGIVVLCSSDDAYASMAPLVSDALKEESIIVVAGFPKDSVEDLKQAGIEHFIHVRSNLLDTLKSFNKLLL